MPVKFNRGAMNIDESTAAELAMDTILKSGRYQDVLRDANVNVNLTHTTSPNAKGEYFPDTGTLNVEPNTNVADLVKTIHHELTHAAQFPAGKESNVNAFNERYRVSHELYAAAVQKGLLYGKQDAHRIAELAAYTASNLKPGTKEMEPRFKEVYDQFPEELRDFYTRTAQPARPVGKHFKGEPEMNIGEKVLNKLFGYKPEVKF